MLSRLGVNVANKLLRLAAVRASVARARAFVPFECEPVTHSEISLAANVRNVRNVSPVIRRLLILSFLTFSERTFQRVIVGIAVT